MKLFRNGRPVPTVFDLFGSNENGMTAAMAFVLASSPVFTERIATAIQGHRPPRNQEGEVRIQTVSKSLGITDIELIYGTDFFAIIEAKRGANLPSDEQLKRYASIARRQPAKSRYLVTMSSVTDDFAKTRFPDGTLGGIPLKHLSWRIIRKLARMSIKGETNANKQLLTRFAEYLGEILEMETIYSNRVYVVSLGKDIPDGWNMSWIDIVEKRSRYFYPIRGGWPDPPPNYMGFRFNAKLQYIRWVKSYCTVTNPCKVIPGAPDEEWPPHYCLTLGKPIIPATTVGVGPRIVRAARCWCMLDTLLTSATVSEALTLTNKRIAKNS